MSSKKLEKRLTSYSANIEWGEMLSLPLAKRFRREQYNYNFAGAKLSKVFFFTLLSRERRNVEKQFAQQDRILGFENVTKMNLILKRKCPVSSYGRLYFLYTVPTVMSWFIYSFWVLSNWRVGYWLGWKMEYRIRNS